MSTHKDDVQGISTQFYTRGTILEVGRMLTKTNNNMSTHSRLGRIAMIKRTNKDNIRIVVSVNTPFSTINIDFYIWDEDILQSQNKWMKEGDDVEVQYHYKNKFDDVPQLDSMKQASIDRCPVCYNNLPATDAQRWQCQECLTLCEEFHKIRIDKEMKLTSSEAIKNYRFGLGYSLNFIDEEINEGFACNVFQDSPLFPKINNMKLLNSYKVIGWMEKYNTKIHSLDIVDIY